MGEDLSYTLKDVFIIVILRMLWIMSPMNEEVAGETLGTHLLKIYTVYLELRLCNCYLIQLNLVSVYRVD